MSEGVVNGQPSLPTENPLGLEHFDSGIIDMVLFPDPGSEKSVERAGVPGLNENPVDPFYRQVLRDDQSEAIALEMLKSKGPEVRSKHFQGFRELLGDGCHHGHWGMPPMRRHSITAPFRAPQALFSLALDFFAHSLRGELPERANILCKTLVHKPNLIPNVP